MSGDGDGDGGGRAPDAADAQKKLALDPSLPLAEGVVSALAGVARYALESADRAASEPAAAVHEYRKSIRRCRALLKLLRGLTGKAAYKDLVAPLRDAARATSSLRDADALLSGALKTLPREEGSGGALVALERDLVEEREAARAAGRVGDALDAHREGLARLPHHLRQALPADLRRRDVRGALRESYAAAQAARAQAADTHADVDLHDWRKRVKELRYQLELLSPLTGETEEHTRLAALAEELGGVTDLIVLRDAVDARRARLGDADPAALRAELERRIVEQKERVLAESEAFFAQKPKAFARVALPKKGR